MPYSRQRDRFHHKKKPLQSSFRIVMHCSMGLSYLIVGVVLWVVDFKNLMWGGSFRYFFGTLCLIYGAFRCYRGMSSLRKKR